MTLINLDVDIYTNLENITCLSKMTSKCNMQHLTL